MRSDEMKLGAERAPQRSLFKAMGYTDGQIRKPLIGIVNSFNEIVPGHIHLQNIARSVKDEFSFTFPLLTASAFSCAFPSFSLAAALT